MQLSRFEKIVKALLMTGILVCGPGFQAIAAAQQPVARVDETPTSPEQELEAMALTARAFRSAAERVLPSLVTIESFGGVSAVQGKIGGIRGQGEGNSTGLMLTSDGLVVTSTFNFIQQPPVITVITSDGQRRIAKMLGRDDIRKICLLKLENVSEFPVPEFVDPDSIEVGQWAVSVGVGYGDSNPAISSGIISATNRIGGRAIQTDANISPANYGGPLVDVEGRVIGICVPMNPQSQAIGAGVEWYDSGIGFAVPLYGAEPLLERLKNGEKIYPAFMGVRVVPNDKGEGIFIEEVVKSSAAEKAGLKRGDRIVSLDGKEVNDIMRQRQILNLFEAGEQIEVGYVPDEETDKKTVTLTLGQPPVPANQPAPLEAPQIR
jgi:serine protease Do